METWFLSSNVHQQERLAFCYEYLDFREFWLTTLFTDEKIWTITGPPGLNGKWKDFDDTTSSEEDVPMEDQPPKNNSLKVWGAFIGGNTLNLQFIDMKMKSLKYCDVLEKAFLEVN